MPTMQIGNRKNGFLYTFIESGPIKYWQCARGSDRAITGEVLVIVLQEEFTVALDATIGQDGEVHMRQPVFRCLTANEPLTDGWHKWQTNWAASITTSIDMPEQWGG